MRKYWNIRNVGERTYKRWPTAGFYSKFTMKAASAPAHTPEAFWQTVHTTIWTKLLTVYLLFHSAINPRRFKWRSMFCLMCWNKAKAWACINTIRYGVGCHIYSTVNLIPLLYTFLVGSKHFRDQKSWKSWYNFEVMYFTAKTRLLLTAIWNWGIEEEFDSHSLSWHAAWDSGLSKGRQCLDGWPLDVTHSTLRSITPAPQVCEHCYARKHTERPLISHSHGTNNEQIISCNQIQIHKWDLSAEP